MVAMASFSEGYQESSHVLQFASSIMNSGKYMMSPELRAEQVGFKLCHSYCQQLIVVRTAILIMNHKINNPSLLPDCCQVHLISVSFSFNNIMESDQIIYLYPGTTKLKSWKYHHITKQEQMNYK